MNAIRRIVLSLPVVAALSIPLAVQAQSAEIPPTQAAGPGSIATQPPQDQVKMLMGAYLALWSAQGPATHAFDFVTEDAVFEYPYADDAYRRIEGREAVGRALRTLPARATKWTFSDPTLFQTLHPDIFFVAYRAKAYVPATQQAYESRYVARVTVRNGRIADYLELWERDAATIAFGTTDNAGRLSSAASPTPIPCESLNN